jgi:hypothetical protein
MTTFAYARVSITIAATLVGCGGQKGPPRHPVGEMTARAMAKLDVIELVVSDPLRAEQVRQVYLQMAALGREFDLARARSILEARSSLEKRAAEAAPAEPASPAELELVLAPPLERGKALFGRYAALMLEARALLSKDEFEKLNGVR